jgi:hypothetical protein
MSPKILLIRLNTERIIVPIINDRKSEVTFDQAFEVAPDFYASSAAA